MTYKSGYFPHPPSPKSGLQFYYTLAHLKFVYDLNPTISCLRTTLKWFICKEEISYRPPASTCNLVLGNTWITNVRFNDEWPKWGPAWLRRGRCSEIPTSVSEMVRIQRLTNHDVNDILISSHFVQM